MRNLLPGFIQERYLEGLLTGSLQGQVLFADITGFTAMTEQLMSRGKEGAEIVSCLLSRLFAGPIRDVHKGGGQIVSFAGDAFTAVFPGAGTSSAEAVARAIQGRILRSRPISTRFGVFTPTVRLSIAGGRIDWGIIETPRRAVYYFRGEALSAAAGENHRCPPGGVCIASSSLPVHAAARPAGDFSIRPIRAAVARRFAPELAVTMKAGGEFRDAACLFISLGDVSGHAGIVAAVTPMVALVEEMGGYAAGLYFEDKGPSMLVVFGLPHAHEDDLLRAATLAGLIRREQPHLRIGLTHGMVFAGFVGSSARATYTAIGDTVNTAARLMVAAEPGDVLLPAALTAALAGKVETRPRPSLTVKGKRHPLELQVMTGVVGAGQAARFSGSFVGRDDELQRGKTRLDVLAAGRNAGIVVVYGDAGIGKSRLVHELCRSSGAVTHLFTPDNLLHKSLNPFILFLKELFSQQDHGTTAENLANFNDRFEALLGRLETAGGEPVSVELRRTKSLLAALLGHVEPGSLYEQLDPKGRSRNTIIALSQLCKGLCLLTPRIFVFDDLQWLDPQSIEAIRAVHAATAESPAAYIATSRPNDDGSFPQFPTAPLAAGAGDTLAVHLAPMTGKDMPGLIKAQLMGVPGPELEAFITQRCQGNPFYVEQVCKYLQEQGLLHTEDGRLHLIEGATEVPGGIRAVVIARFDRLSIQLRELVQTASVLGLEFNVKVLSAMLGGTDIDGTIALGLHRALWSPLSEIIYLFSHPLLRETAYDMQLRRRLRRLHRLAAEVLERLYSAEPRFHADIALHYERAEIKNKALQYLVKAGDYARDNYHNAEAVDLYNRALAIPGDSQEHFNARIHVGRVYSRIGKWEETERNYRAAMAIATGTGDRLQLANANDHLGQIIYARGGYAEAIPYHEEAVALFESLDEPIGVCSALNGIAVA
ncbi:AAA family ATPase, partial [bacterium]|nr:AAA family ATPase [candidate division CSSED10-310 bacterium]